MFCDAIQLDGWRQCRTTLDASDKACFVGLWQVKGFVCLRHHDARRHHIGQKRLQFQPMRASAAFFILFSAGCSSYS